MKHTCRLQSHQGGLSNINQAKSLQLNKQLCKAQLKHSRAFSFTVSQYADDEQMYNSAVLLHLNLIRYYTATFHDKALVCF